MTLKRQRFIAEFMKDQNGTQAAIRAGFSKKNAGWKASRLLKEPKVRASIDAAMEKIREQSAISAVWILDSLKEVAERCMQKHPVMIFDKVEKEYVQKTDEDGEGVWEFDSAGANRALELLGKNKALFIENMKHSGSISLEKILGETHQ